MVLERPLRAQVPKNREWHSKEHTRHQRTTATHGRGRATTERHVNGENRLCPYERKARGRRGERSAHCEAPEARFALTSIYPVMTKSSKIAKSYVSKAKQAQRYYRVPALEYAVDISGAPGVWTRRRHKSIPGIAEERAIETAAAAMTDVESPESTACETKP